jgi:hypothetical protein
MCRESGNGRPIASSDCVAGTFRQQELPGWRPYVVVLPLATRINAPAPFPNANCSAVTSPERRTIVNRLGRDPSRAVTDTAGTLM